MKRQATQKNFEPTVFVYHSFFVFQLAWTRENIGMLFRRQGIPIVWIHLVNWYAPGPLLVFLALVLFLDVQYRRLTGLEYYRSMIMRIIRHG